MKMQQEGKKVTLWVEGSVGETSALFSWKLPPADELILDMSKATTINSIGVKTWIMWTVRLPKTMHVRIVNAPFVIASQASMVFGFISENMTLDSFVAPYMCSSCGAEELIPFRRGSEYEYSKGTEVKWLKLPVQPPCTKCRQPLEPDFIEKKTFQFLK